MYDYWLFPDGEKGLVMNTIETKTKYPCDNCPKHNGCRSCDCRDWREWLKEAWAVVTAEVKAADERSRDD